MRTSQGTFIASHEDGEGVLAWIEDRLAQLTGLPADHGEVGLPLLAMHYGGGEGLPMVGGGGGRLGRAGVGERRLPMGGDYP